MTWLQGWSLDDHFMHMETPLNGLPECRGETLHLEGAPPPPQPPERFCTFSTYLSTRTERFWVSSG